jgi:hypothetical protein
MHHLTQAALDKRLERARRSHLRETFGTDDPEEIKAKLAKAEAYEAEKETERQKQLTEQQRITEERDREKARADAAEAKALDLATEHEHQLAVREVREHAQPFIKPKFIKHAMEDFHDYLSGLGPKKVASLAADYPAQWFKEYVEENPEVALTPPEAPEPPGKTPLTTGGGGTRPSATPSGNTQPKTFAPGKANSMTPEESRAAARARGLRW